MWYKPSKYGCFMIVLPTLYPIYPAKKNNTRTVITTSGTCRRSPPHSAPSTAVFAVLGGSPCGGVGFGQPKPSKQMKRMIQGGAP